MKDLPPGLADHVAGEVTTLCRCWRLVRSDGVVLGFTDHDRDLSFEGITHAAASGLTGSRVEQTLGLSVDGLEVVGALMDDALTDQDLACGLWDNAALTIYVVDWSDPANRVIQFAGSIGEVSRTRSAFSAEIRSLSHVLAQSRGRLYQRACDADVGDGRCRVDLTDPAFCGIGTVIEVYSDRAFRVSGLDAFASDWFARGALTWASGANAAALMEVRSHVVGNGIVLELTETMPLAVGVGDTFTVTAGCDKSFDNCREKFANRLNFRGFPHMPGNDWITGYPTQGQGNGGGSLVGD